MTTLAAIWLGIGACFLAFQIIAWLKGAFGLVAAINRRRVHEFGTSWTLAVSAEPFHQLLATFVVATFGVAQPESRWARWLYGEQRMAKAKEKYGAPGATV